MNASISISNMKTTDAGTYTCEVHNFPDIEGTTQANIRLHVFGTKVPSGLNVRSKFPKRPFQKRPKNPETNLKKSTVETVATFLI